MKHLYLLLTAMLCCMAATFAQTRYWVGPASGANWNDTNNWAISTSGTPGATVPNAGTFDVIFDKTTEVNVNITSFALNTLTVTGSQTVRLYSPAATTTITLNSTNVAAPAIKIDAGSTLEDSASTGGADFLVNFANGAQGSIQGTWSFMGVPTATAYVSLPSTTGLGNLIDIDGTLKIANDQGFVDCEVPAYLNFKTGSTYLVNRNGGSVPRGTWDVNSTVLVTGIKSAAPTIKLPATGLGIGNLVIDCPGITNDVFLSLPNTLKISGNLQFLHTNNFNMYIGQTVAGPVPYIVEKNLEIGANCIATLSPNNNYTYTMQVNGNFVQTGGTFYLRNAGGTVTLPITLGVAGNITQTAGTFGSLNTTTSTSAELFTLELNGTTNQNISFSSGTIDNATNQVTLRLNNTAGATLTAPLSVGKISWNSSNKGNLHTSSPTNLLTINNTSTTDALVVNAPSNSGFVSGPVARQTAANVLYSFPTGKAGVLRACEVRPTAATASLYEAEYFGTAYSDLSVLTPLSGVSNQEYWNISKVSGSDAVIRLTLAAAVPGASATDRIIVAHYNGADWERADGTKLAPGTVSAGSAETDTLASFSPFTFAYAPATSLPIYLLNFTARKDGATAKLDWTITDNSTPERFEVLRSLNGTDFSLLGTVSGAAQKWSYAFTDETLPVGTIYYRLRMIDVNQAVQLSKIVAVVNGNKDVLITSIIPTVVTNTARLDISAGVSGTIRLVVTDINGRILLQQTNSLVAGNQQISLNNVAGLSLGTYHVTGYLSNGTRTATVRFIKQ